VGAVPRMGEGRCALVAMLSAVSVGPSIARPAASPDGSCQLVHEMNLYGRSIVNAVASIRTARSGRSHGKLGPPGRSPPLMAAMPTRGLRRATPLHRIWPRIVGPVGITVGNCHRTRRDRYRSIMATVLPAAIQKQSRESGRFGRRAATGSVPSRCSQVGRVPFRPSSRINVPRVIPSDAGWCVDIPFQIRRFGHLVVVMATC